MKRSIILLFLVICSVSAFAQFPLGSTKNDIKAYFDQNVSYSRVDEFKVDNSTNAICFTKTKVVGDYTFFFDFTGLCTSYIVTYDKNELPALEKRFDNQFCRVQKNEWEAEDGTFDATLMRPKNGENYFSIIYKPVIGDILPANTLASN